MNSQNIAINEIMYNVEGSDTHREWIEIINKSTSTIDIGSWRFYDGSSHVLKSARGDLLVYPQEYVILASSGTVFIDEHPQCGADVVDTVMSLKNTSCEIALMDDSGGIIDSLTYYSQWNGNVEGKSIERSNSGGDSNDLLNWHESINYGGSPGIKNSSGKIIETEAAEGDNFPVITEIAPCESQDFIELYFVEGGSCPGFDIYQGETAVKHMGARDADSGDYWVVYFNSTGVDDINDSDNNGRLDFHSQAGGVTSTDSVVSIRDSTDGSIINAVSYSNQDKTSFKYKSSYDAAVGAGVWFPAVTTGETADYELNSVNYKSGSAGKSITRKTRSSGSPLVNMPGSASDWYIAPVLTPGGGYYGGVVYNRTVLEIAGTNPFSPYDSDANRRFLSVSYQVPDCAVKNLFVFDINGRERFKLIDDDLTFQGVSLSGQGSGIINWDGCGPGGSICPMGVYILYLEAVDNQTGSNWHGRKTCVLAKPLR